MFHLPPSERHYQFHPNSINEFSKCFIVSLFQTFTPVGSFSIKLSVITVKETNSCLVS